MSAEWTRTQIKHLGRIVTGKTPATSRPEFFDGDIPFLTPTDMTDGVKVVTATRRLTKAGLATVKNCLIPKGVAVSCIGWQMGKSVLVLEPTVTNQQINTVVVDESRFDLHFVYYLMATMREKIFQHGATATRTPIVNKSSFGELSIVVPRLSEQKRIAEFFSALDDRIALLRETNATLEAMAQALFKSWFVDFDPVHANAGTRAATLPADLQALFPSTFTVTPQGPVPEGWKVSPLDAVASYLNGLALQKFPPTGHDDLPVIKIAQLKKGDTGGADQASRSIKPEYIIQNGDVLFSWSGSLEVSIWCGGEGALNQHLFKVTSDKYPKWFYYLWTRHHLPHFQQIAASKATTMGHIQRKHLTEALTIIPSPAILSAADEALAPLIEQVINNALQAQTLATLRDTLLPRLISGQLRLPDAEAAVAEAGA